MSYGVVLAPDDAQAVLAAMDDKSKRIVRENLNKLADNPYPRPVQKVAIEENHVRRD
ncbi:hypothetical protein [Halalkalicoccus salilacus]|uniref:hypothetical protein n=1 Tax=Halalkalicoccus salilacus TaxID=3117459 RepID=UPI00300F3323